MKLFPLSFLILIFFTSAFAQTVTVTREEKTYTRPNPMSEYKTTFKVARPVVKAATPALSKRITTAVSPETVLELNINEELADYQWLEEADYEVTYNKHGLLGAKLWMEGSAAYPDSVTKRVVVNTKTGVPVKIADVFTSLPKLATEIRKRQKKDVNDTIREIKADKESGETNPEELFAETTFTVNSLGEFEISEDGATFFYDYSFPHVIQAFEPLGQYKFTWAELKPFIKPRGLLARFAN